jgi:type II secretory pathway predicted ATPase ExeA
MQMPVELEEDCRAVVFRERGSEVLGSVVQGTQIAKPDPFDVDQVHAPPRRAFDNTLDRVRADSSSRILLIRGEAGSGKTHLIRSLRAKTHAAGRGVVAYVHMTSETIDYRQYLLRQVVRSLADPYVHRAEESIPVSALDLIGEALAQQLGADKADQLREADDATLAHLVSDGADELSDSLNPDGTLRFADIHLNMLRIFLYRLSTHRSIQRRVSSFLNGEPLGEMDWQRLAALPRDCDRGSMYLLGQLARMLSATIAAPLILCIDQIEASDLTGKDHGPFVHAMGTACELIENVPRLMVVLSCLDAAYTAHAPHLIASYRHRIEQDPAPVRLTDERTADELRQIISCRLRWLYEGIGLQHVPPNSVFPLPETLPEQLAQQQLRAVLDQLRQYREQCFRAGKVVEWREQGVRPPQDISAVDRLRLDWNEFLTGGMFEISEDDSAQLDLLTWAIGQSALELDEPVTIRTDRADASSGGPPGIIIAIDRPRAPSLSRRVGLCEKDPRGNGLFNQISGLEQLRSPDDQMLAVIRSAKFPKRGRVARHLDELKKRGDVCLVIEEGWKTMQAMRMFLATKLKAVPADVIAQWRQTDRPIAGLLEIQAILNLPPVDVLAAPAPVSTPSPRASAKPARRPGSAESALRTDSAPSVKKPRRSAAPAGTDDQPSLIPVEAPAVRGADPTGLRTDSAPPVKTPTRSAAPAGADHQPSLAPVEAPAVRGADPAPLLGPMVIGKTDSFSPAEVTLDPQILTRHTAIFGANGSGKTVLALTILELLLERGVSVILFDRKGDLATYAVEEAWNHETDAPNAANRRQTLRRRLDIHLYTPGCSNGRPLALPLLPEGLAALSDADRRDQALQAAHILCDVCSPAKAKHDMFTAVLTNAIEMLCVADIPHTLDNLEHVLLDPPSDLLNRLPAHGAKDCEQVGRRLNERRIAFGRLFSDEGERLDLLGMLRPGGNRVRLNIINTQFLEGEASLIWIAQFLAAAGRFIVEHPAPGGQLQAVLMFDEADQYIPAVRAPATKAGMENLLRRARGAGVGLLLTTQNVGDFDYKALDNITTVFAGKLASQRALEKLESRLGRHVDRLAKKARGHFVIAAESQVQDILGNMCLVKPITVPREQIEQLAAAQTVG